MIYERAGVVSSYDRATSFGKKTSVPASGARAETHGESGERLKAKGTTVNLRGVDVRNNGDLKSNGDLRSNDGGRGGADGQWASPAVSPRAPALGAIVQGHRPDLAGHGGVLGVRGTSPPSMYLAQVARPSHEATTEKCLSSYT